ncbi:MAG: glutaredoxin 3 [Reyranellaceae bacterium]
MAKIEIYTTPICPYCARAKGLLEDKGAAFEEIDVFMDVGQREQMRRRAGGRNTVPQIFIDGAHIGGCDELVALERAGKLDPLLQSA